jgi:two-component system, cell cycle sensor histidine kinase and response regulator CckA
MSRVVAESTQAMVVCDGNAVSRAIIHANLEFERLTGFSREGAIGHSLSQLLRPPGGQFEWERVDAVLASKEPWRKALPAARKDGTVFWADLHVYPLKHDGAPTHWVGVITDVTDHLELHEALRQSEAQHRLLAENIQDLITVHRANGRCLFASPSSRAMLGYGQEELIGKPLRLILHPADRAAARRIFESHFSGRSESIFVHRMRRKDGTYLWAETTSKARWEIGSPRPTEIISITRDISKRRQAEDNLRAMHNLLDAVYEAVPVGLCLLNTAGYVVQCNRAFARAFDLQPSAIAGRPADTLLPALTLNRAAVSQNVPCECECVDAQGTPFPTEITIVTLEQNVGAQRLVALTNLRERKKIEARLREANQLESLGTLAGGIAHDFNNMLAIVLAYSSLLRDAAGDPERVAHYADTIIDAGQRGADVVRQLQLFASTHDADTSATDVHAVLERTLKDTLAGWPANIHVIRSFNAANSVVTADPVQLVQALNKLLDNARLSMPAGGTLSVRTSDLRQQLYSPGAPAETKNYLRISVEDDGAGMDPTAKSRMFEPFFTRGKMAESAGIGLAVVYGIMRAHRGSIEVHSAPGQGTRIHLLFPRAEAELVAITQPPFAPTVPASERRSILLVEDEQDIGAIWQELLPTDGWRVLWARDGSEALRLFRAHRDEIALVFTDIGLPLIDGWQVADTVRKETSTMPLLIASGAFRHGDRQRGYAEPVAYLSKPYVLTKVMQQIRTLAMATNISAT